MAAGAIESTRLLLLSASGAHPDGLGNNSGQLGKHLVFHHLWTGFFDYKEKLYPGRFGGVKIEFSSRAARVIGNLSKVSSASDILKTMSILPHRRPIKFHAESLGSPEKYVKLSDRTDRFGDPFAHVHYQSSDFDHESYLFSLELFRKFSKATDAYNEGTPDEKAYDSGAHHMGSTRMGDNGKESVLDKFCRVHSTKNLFVLGSSSFTGSTAVNPTLTIAALAVRAAEFIEDQL